MISMRHNHRMISMRRNHRVISMAQNNRMISADAGIGTRRARPPGQPGPQVNGAAGACRAMLRTARRDLAYCGTLVVACAKSSPS
jgi:hypothetical protein